MGSLKRLAYTVGKAVTGSGQSLLDSGLMKRLHNISRLLDQGHSGWIQAFDEYVCWKVNEKSDIARIYEYLLPHINGQPASGTSRSTHDYHSVARNQLGRLRGKHVQVCSLIEESARIKVIQPFVSRIRHFLFGINVFYPSDSSIVQGIMNLTRQQYSGFYNLQRLIQVYWDHVKQPLWQQLTKKKFSNKIITLLHNVDFNCTKLLEPSELVVGKDPCEIFATNKIPANTNASHWSNVLADFEYVLTIVEEFLNCTTVEGRFVGFDNLAEFQSYLEEHQDNILRSPIGIMFENAGDNDAATSPLVVTLRKSLESFDATYQFQLMPQHAPDLPKNHNEIDRLYFNSAFIDIQDMLGNAAIQYARQDADETERIGINLKFLPFPPFTKSLLVELISLRQPLIMTISWFITIVLCIKYILDEKEHGMLAVVQLYDVPFLTIELAWLTVFIMPVLLYCILITGTLWLGRVLEFSNPSLIFVHIVAHGIAVILSVLNWSSLFRRASLASIGFGVVYMLFCLPGSVIQRYQQLYPLGVLVTASFIPPTGHILGWNEIFRMERNRSGAHWTNLWYQDDSTLRFNLGHSFLVVTLYIGIQTLILVAKHIYLSNQAKCKRYDCNSPDCLSSDAKRTTPSSPSPHPLNESIEELQLRNFFAPTDQASACASSPSFGDCRVIFKSSVCNNDFVQIESDPGFAMDALEVFFDKVLVLDNVSYQFEPKKVTVILGHNGTGKSTLLATLAGLVSPSKGRIMIHGHAMQGDGRGQARDAIGYCPQHCNLYRELSGIENIVFFAHLRGLSSSRLLEEMTRFDLSRQNDDLVERLSYGQQRKLSVALAFMGNPSTVLLDEPTAGLDALSEGRIWHIIESMKHGRTVIIACHHLHEARRIGDNIVVLYRGKLHGLHSSSTLESTSPTNYKLIIETVKQHLVYIHELICRNHPLLNLELISKSDTTITYRIPYRDVFTGQFVEMIQSLETDWSRSRKCRIRIGLTDTTYDDLYFNLADKKVDNRATKADPNDAILESPTEDGEMDTVLRNRRERRFSYHPLLDSCIYGDSSNLAITSYSQIDESTAEAPVLVQSLLMMSKWANYAWRNWAMTVLECFFTALVILPVVVAILFYQPTVTQPSLAIGPWLWNSHTKANGSIFFSQCPCEDNDQLDNEFILSSSKSLHTGEFWQAMSSYPMSEVVSDTRITPFYKMTVKKDDCQFLVLDTDSKFVDLMPKVRMFHLRTKQTDSLDIGKQLVRLQQNDIGLIYGGIILEKDYFRDKVHPKSLSVSIRNILSKLDKSFLHIDLTDSVLQTLEQNLLGTFMWSKPPKNHFKLYYNNLMQVSPVIMLNIAHNAQLRAITTSSNQLKYNQMVIQSRPLSFRKFNWGSSIRQSLMSDGLIALFFMIGISLIPANSVISLIRERQTGIRHMQQLSGLRPMIYRAVHLVWDLFIYSINLGIGLLTLLTFGVLHPAGLQANIAMISLLLIYGCVSVVFAAILANYFTSPNKAFVFVFTIKLAFNALSTTLDFLLRIIALKLPEYGDMVVYLRGKLIILPPYASISAVHDVIFERSLSEQGYNSQGPFNGWVVFKMRFVYMTIALIGLLIFWTIIECYTEMDRLRRIIAKVKSLTRTNLLRRVSESVQSFENDSILSDHTTNINFATKDRGLFLDNVSKRRSRSTDRPLIDNLTLSLYRGQCFGILGPNGCGKSTLLSLLAGNERPDSGRILLDDDDISRQFLRTRSYRPGYCPENNALDDYLSVRETLEHHGRMRGISDKRLTVAVDTLLASMQLSRHAHKTVATLSGGIRRQLAVAVAFLARPSVILLDEPFKGMDPSAKRLVLGHIDSAIRSNGIVVFAASALRECESICSRVGILFKGAVRGITTPLGMRHHLCLSYTIKLSLANTNGSDWSEVEEQIARYLPKFQLTHPPSSTELQTYEYPQTAALNELLSSLVKLKELNLIKHVRISHTPMEKYIQELCERSTNSEMISAISDI